MIIRPHRGWKAHERAIRYALVLSLASATTSFSRTTLARADADLLHPPAAAIKKGTGHVACAYIMYLTIETTLTACFPGEYPLLHRHVEKWIPIFRKYSDDNAANERQKFHSGEEIRNMNKFEKSLNNQTCPKIRPFIEQFSGVLTRDMTATENGLEAMLQKADAPGANYGCL